METRALEVTNVRVTDNYGYRDVFLCLSVLAIVFKASTLLFVVVKRFKACFQSFKKASVLKAHNGILLVLMIECK